jgi:hypothetical protein
MHPANSFDIGPILNTFDIGPVLKTFDIGPVLKDDFVFFKILMPVVLIYM